MFAPYCPRHGYRLLLGYESVVGLEHSPCGPVVLLRCHCGELLTHDTQDARCRQGSDDGRLAAAASAAGSVARR